MTSIPRYEKYIQNCLDLCFSKFKRFAEEGKVFDMSKWTNAMAFDVVGELGYGAPLGHMETETDVNGLRKMIGGVSKLASCLGHFPRQIRWISNPVTGAILSLFGAQSGMQKFELWCAERLAKRKKGEDEAVRPDMLYHFMNMKSLDGKGQARDDEAMVEAGGLSKWS
jgi:cytochrome P450